MLEWHLQQDLLTVMRERGVIRFNFPSAKSLRFFVAKLPSASATELEMRGKALRRR